MQHALFLLAAPLINGQRAILAWTGHCVPALCNADSVAALLLTLYQHGLVARFSFEPNTNLLEPNHITSHPKVGSRFFSRQLHQMLTLLNSSCLCESGHHLNIDLPICHTTGHTSGHDCDTQAVDRRFATLLDTQQHALHVASVHIFVHTDKVACISLRV